MQGRRVQHVPRDGCQNLREARIRSINEQYEWRVGACDRFQGKDGFVIDAIVVSSVQSSLRRIGGSDGRNESHRAAKMLQMAKENSRPCQWPGFELDRGLDMEGCQCCMATKKGCKIVVSLCGSPLPLVGTETALDKTRKCPGATVNDRKNTPRGLFERTEAQKTAVEGAVSRYTTRYSTGRLRALNSLDTRQSKAWADCGTAFFISVMISFGNHRTMVLQLALDERNHGGRLGQVV
ncbi:hypothetical protein FB451DRAFT_1483845 [Mycena latifolia]|nr:hypothetical protein FB451DRAFT_1483845 [Mycena latifolia]